MITRMVIAAVVLALALLFGGPEGVVLVIGLALAWLVLVWVLVCSSAVIERHKALTTKRR